MTTDALTRRAIIAAHGAAGTCGSRVCSDPPESCPPLSKREVGIVEAWRADRDDLLKGAAANALNITARAEKAEAEVERLHSWGGLLELLDEHWPADIFPMPEGLDDAQSRTRRDTGPIILGLIRWVDKLSAEIMRYRKRAERVLALADVSGWHVYESRDTGDVYPADSARDLVADIRAALDGTEAENG